MSHFVKPLMSLTSLISLALICKGSTNNHHQRSWSTSQLPRSIRDAEFHNRFKVACSVALLSATLPNPRKVAAKEEGEALRTENANKKVSKEEGKHEEMHDKSSTNVVSNKPDDGFISGLISGAVSRASKEILLHPIDTIRARQQIPTATTKGKDNSNNNANFLLYKDLYDGIVPALVGGIPAGALFFGVKDFSKQQLRSMGLSKEAATLLSVTIANVPYWLVRNPSEVLKTRQQVQVQGKDGGCKEEMLGGSSTSYEKLQAMVAAEGGSVSKVASKLYSSYSSNIAYALPADLVKFLVYEYLLNKKEGQKVEGFEAALTGAAAGLVAQVITTPLDVARTRIMSRKDDVDDGGENGDNLLRQESPITMMNKIVKEEGIEALTKGLAPRSVRAIASGAIQFASYELSQNFIKSM